MGFRVQGCRPSGFAAKFKVLGLWEDGFCCGLERVLSEHSACSEESSQNALASISYVAQMWRERSKSCLQCWKYLLAVLFEVVWDCLPLRRPDYEHHSLQSFFRRGLGFRA